MANIQRRPRGVTIRRLAVSFVVLYVVQHVIFLHLTPLPDSSSSIISTLDDHPQQITESVIFDLEAEIQKNIEYVHSIKDVKRKLYFVHIPKTAGTTIEDIGGLHASPKLSWGSCRFNHKPKRPGHVCEYPPNQFEWPTKIGWWHLPSYFFPLLGSNPYENADLFAVVRDPIDRLLSEFYYVCRKEKNKNWNGIECDKSRIHDATYLNEWIQIKLNHIVSNRSLAETYLFDNGHYTPQYDFIINRGANVRTMDYVLHLKNLRSEFQWLMNAYDIKATIPEGKRNNVARNDTLDLTVKHLDQNTLALIDQLYKHDWDLFPATTKG